MLRIRSYLGVERKFASWEEAVEALKASNSGFESLSNVDWMNVARRIYKSENGLPRLNYDPGLAHNFASVEDIKAGRIPQLWELYAATKTIPTSLLRGENSDLLSADTVVRMQSENPNLDATTVQNRGHAPFLDEPESVAAIHRWLDRI